MIHRSALGRLAAFGLFLVASSFAMAADVTLGNLVIRQPWARATPKGATVGGGYLTIENKGSVTDRLTGGTFAASRGFEMHSMSMEGGVMRMRPTGPLDIPAGKTVTLDPAGLHIMFTGLERGLKQGEAVAGTLTFEHAGTAAVQFEVEGIGAKGPGGSAGSPMPGMDMH